MLRISKKLDYSLIILAHLAHALPGELTSARDVARTYGLPLPITAGILKTLAKHEIVRSLRGVHGGYLLSLEPSKLNLSRIIEAIEGPFQLADCIPMAPHAGHNRDCEYMDRCPVRRPVNELHRVLHQTLGNISLAELAGTRDLLWPKPRLEEAEAVGANA
ncbi:MAG: Rrf2 family transcriptional regulator [Candidatus Hydrogenedentota bacterium]